MRRKGKRRRKTQAGDLFSTAGKVVDQKIFLALTERFPQ